MPFVDIFFHAGSYSDYFNIGSTITVSPAWKEAKLVPTWYDGDKPCYGSNTSEHLAIQAEALYLDLKGQEQTELARVVLIPCGVVLETTSSLIPTTTTPYVDPCNEDRGGCEQYCSSSGQEVTCICSSSFVVSTQDNTKCDGMVFSTSLYLLLLLRLFKLPNLFE